MSRSAVGLCLAHVVLVAALSGCGQTGALYLPGDPPPVAEPSDEDPESNERDDADEPRA